MCTAIKNKKSARGFTLIETLIALVIGVAVSLLIVMVVTAGLASIRSSHNTERLHSETVYIADTLTYWIKQSRALNVPDSQTLEIILPDASVRTITLSGTAITLDGVAITGSAVEVTILGFTELPRSARISFMLKSADSDKTFSATTTIAQRN